MRSFQRRLDDFNARGIRLAAISADPPEVSRRQCQRLGFTYTFLSDPKVEVGRRYDLLHPAASPRGTDIARPAEFLIDETGTVRWLNLTEGINVRARPDQVIKAYDAWRASKPGA